MLYLEAIRDASDRIREASLDAGLLMLRLGASLTVLVLFGLPQLKEASIYVSAGRDWALADLNRGLGIPLPMTFSYFQVLSGVLGTACVASGFLNRGASALMGTIFAITLYFSSNAEAAASSEIGVFYCLIFATLTLTGPGRFSADWLMCSLKSRSRRVPRPR